MNETKEKLIKIAITTIQKYGINGLTIRDLGNAVGIKSSSVLYHFNNKDGLLNELIKVYNENFFLILKDIDNKHTSALDRLDALVSLFQNVLSEDKLCLCAMLASDNEILDQITKKNTQDFFRELEIWIKNNILELKLDANLSLVLISSLEGAMLIDKLNNNSQKLSAIRVWLKTL
ncbi:MAG: TetR/AcrR family transcriptional regulator [Campylobacteraceae bacterium]|nr:TetR/AcrR family transcriptional regulator [Campylobacteraceae bacterium]